MLLDLINVAINLYTCTTHRKVREEKFINLETVTPFNIMSIVRFYLKDFILNCSFCFNLFSNLQPKY